METCKFSGADSIIRITDRKEKVYSFFAISLIFLKLSTMVLQKKGGNEMKEQKRQVNLVTAGLLLGLVLASLDQTIVATAMPTITKEWAGLSLYSWVFAIYMLASTITMPIYGKLADLFGTRIVYLSGLALFLAGSLLCGWSGSMMELITARGVQGLGAGALLPIAFTIVGELYPPEQRGKFQGLFGAVFALASMVGPTLGGIIVEKWDWGWIFFLNLPIGIPAFLLIALAWRGKTIRDKKPQIDWYGAISLSAAVLAILLALVIGGERHDAWGSWPVLGLFGTGLLLTGLFIWVESKAKEPLLPLSLFRIPAIGFGNIAGFFVSAALFGAIAYIPLFVQGVRGASPAEAGYMLTPLMLSVAVSSAIGGRLLAKASFRAILVPSLVLIAIGFYLLGQLQATTPNSQLLVSMIVTGLGMGAVFPALGTAAQSAVPPEARGVAMSTSQFFRSIGGTMGISVFGTILAWRMQAGMNEVSGMADSTLSAEQLAALADPKLLLDEQLRSALAPESLAAVQHVFSEALHGVFFSGMLLIFISLAASMLLGRARLIEKEPRRSLSAKDRVPKA